MKQALDDGYVCVASEADEPEEDVLKLAYRLEGAMMLPFCIYADATGAFLDGTSGHLTPDSFLAKLREVAKR